MHARPPACTHARLHTLVSHICTGIGPHRCHICTGTSVAQASNMSTGTCDDFPAVGMEVQRTTASHRVERACLRACVRFRACVCVCVFCVHVNACACAACKCVCVRVRCVHLLACVWKFARMCMCACVLSSSAVGMRWYVKPSCPTKLSTISLWHAARRTL